MSAIIPLTDCVAIRSSPDVAHERPVDLNSVKWEIFQITQAGKPGPKVVDGKTNAHLGHMLQRLRDCRRQQIEEYAFGYLEFQRGGDQTMITKDALDEVNEVRLAQLNG